jgi:hypothetical protein
MIVIVRVVIVRAHARSLADEPLPLKIMRSDSCSDFEAGWLPLRVRIAAAGILILREERGYG